MKFSLEKSHDLSVNAELFADCLACRCLFFLYLPLWFGFVLPSTEMVVIAFTILTLPTKAVDWTFSTCMCKILKRGYTLAAVPALRSSPCSGELHMCTFDPHPSPLQSRRMTLITGKKHFANWSVLYEIVNPCSFPSSLRYFIPILSLRCQVSSPGDMSSAGAGAEQGK